MDKQTYIELLNLDAKKYNYKNELIDFSLKNPNYISILISNIEKVDYENSSFSARILELTIKKNIELIIPFINTFCDFLNKVKFTQTIRSCSKICELLMIEYFIKDNVKIIHSIQNKDLEKIIEAGFNWMINDQPIAVQAYTMQTLFLLGTKYNWIHSELAFIIEKNIPYSSIGYKNRGRKVLKAIKTNTNLKL